MSKIAYCPRGGLEGILLTKKEIRGEIIPLPCMLSSKKINPSKCTEDHDGMSDSIYWEVDETGSHGWCCSTCGKVLQWG